MRNFSRREFLAGLGAALVMPKSAEASESHEHERAALRQEQFDLLMADWSEPQERLEGHSLSELCSDLRDQFGPWFVVFAKLNELHHMQELLTHLSRLPRNHPSWSSDRGPAADFEALYDRLWSGVTEKEKAQNETTPKLTEVPDPLKEMFESPDVLPQGFRAPVKEVVWHDGRLHSPFMPRGGAVDGMSLPTPESFFSERKMRRIHVGIPSYESADRKMEVIFHEFAHANDWDTGDYPADYKIYLYWKVTQLARERREKDTQHVNMLRPFSELSFYERWREVMECWPTMATQYFMGEELLPEERSVIASTIARIDPEFNSAQSRARGIALLQATK